MNALDSAPNSPVHSTSVLLQLERAENVRSMLDLKPIELYAVLRKNPAIFLLDPAVVRARYNGIHKVRRLRGATASQSCNL